VLGFSGSQALIKADTGQELRADLERLERDNEISALIEGVRKRGVNEKVTSSAISDVHSHRMVVPNQRANRNEHLISPQPGKSKSEAYQDGRGKLIRIKLSGARKYITILNKPYR